MTKVPAGKIENGRTARSFFEPTFHTNTDLLAARMLEDFDELPEKARAGTMRHATTTISRQGIMRVVRRIERVTDQELSFFTDKYPLLDNGMRPTLPYPALVALSNGTRIKADHLLTVLLDADHVTAYFQCKGELTYPNVVVLGHEAVNAFQSLKRS